MALNTDSGGKCSLSINDVGMKISTGTPPPFGRDEKTWSAVHLFLASVSNDFLITLKAFSEKAGIVMNHFSCNAIGQIEIINRRYRITNINLYPKILVADEKQQRKMETIIDKTNRNCLIINSLNVNVFFHTQIDIR